MCPKELDFQRHILAVFESDGGKESRCTQRKKMSVLEEMQLLERQISQQHCQICFEEWKNKGSNLNHIRGVLDK